MSATASHNFSDSGSSKKSRGISRGGRNQRTALAFCGVGETSPDVVARQLRKIGKDLRLRHAAGQTPQDVAYGNAGAANARLTKSDGRIHADSVQQVHRRSLRQLICPWQKSIFGPAVIRRRAWQLEAAGPRS